MITDVVVVIPAADEQDEINGCLHSVQTARRVLHDATGGRVRSRVVVVLDGCRDDTAAVVALYPDVEVVVSTARRVGSARRIGVTHALGVSATAGLWLASTDADCRVPADWLLTMVAQAERGADLVLGTVRPAEGLSSAVSQAWYAAHHLGDGHPHVHGANLGISATSYLDVGGWRDHATDEDVDLVSRVVSAGRLTIIRSGSSPVITSVRLAGRAPAGFAGYLDELGAEVPAAG